MSDELHAAFWGITALLFPRWNREGTWRIRRSHRSEETSEDGFCDESSRTIWIAPGTTGAELQAVVAHEICHAITGPGHGKRFRNRLTKAAIDAGVAERDLLKRKLLTEAAQYEHTPRVTAQEIYCTVGDIVMDIPRASFQDVLYQLSKYYGLTRQELFDRYSKLRSAYGTARQVRGDQRTDRE